MFGDPKSPLSARLLAIVRPVEQQRPLFAEIDFGKMLKAACMHGPNAGIIYTYIGLGSALNTSKGLRLSSVVGYSMYFFKEMGILLSNS